MWAPDGRSVVYRLSTGLITPAASVIFGPLSLGRAVRTLLRADGPHAGDVIPLAWTRPPAVTSYRSRGGGAPATVGPSVLTARSPVTRLAADGNRVAFVSCGHVFVLDAVPAAPDPGATPTTSLTPNCSSEHTTRRTRCTTSRLRTTGSPSGTRKAATASVGAERPRSPARRQVVLARSRLRHARSAFDGDLGHLAGAESSLVFGKWSAGTRAGAGLRDPGDRQCGGRDGVPVSRCSGGPTARTFRSTSTATGSCWRSRRARGRSRARVPAASTPDRWRARGAGRERARRNGRRGASRLRRRDGSAAAHVAASRQRRCALPAAGLVELRAGRGRRARGLCAWARRVRGVGGGARRPPRHGRRDVHRTRDFRALLRRRARLRCGDKLRVVSYSALGSA